MVTNTERIADLERQVRELFVLNETLQKEREEMSQRLQEITSQHENRNDQTHPERNEQEHIEAPENEGVSVSQGGFVRHELDVGLCVVQVNEETQEYEGSEKPTVNKLLGMVIRLRRDLKNYSTWETSLLNALDMIDVDGETLQRMKRGLLRPSRMLNKTLKTLVFNSIDKEEKTIRNKLKPFMTGDIIEYQLNSGVAMIEVVRKHYKCQVENREETLIRRLRKLKFDGQNLTRYNAIYLDIYTELRELGSVRDAKKDVRDYVKSLGNEVWVFEVLKFYDSQQDDPRCLEKCMEKAVRMFLLQNPEGRNRSMVLQTSRVRSSGSTPQTIEAGEECRHCNFRHAKNRCPAYGKVCVYCGKRNHFKAACIKYKRDSLTRRELRPRIGGAVDVEQNRDNSSTPRMARLANTPEVTTQDTTTENEYEAEEVERWVAMAHGDLKLKHHTFLIDSGASDTLTGNKKILKDYKDIKDTLYKTAGKEELRVIGIGTIEVKTSLGIIKMQCGYAPNLPKEMTLISTYDLAEVDVETHFAKGENASYVESKNKRQYLRPYGKCYILAVTKDTECDKLIYHVNTPISEETIDTREKWLVWHKRLAHASPTKMKATLGDKLKVSKEDMVCEHCLEANAHVDSFVTHKGVVEDEIDSFKVNSKYAYTDYKVLRQGLILHILYNGWLEMYYQEDKSKTESNLLRFLAQVYPKPLKLIADEDTPFDSEKLELTLCRMGISIALVPPLHHQLNNVEPRIRYSMEKVRAIILDLQTYDSVSLDNPVWMKLIISYVSYVVNRIGESPTAFEKRYDKKPDVNQMRPFFAKCVVPKLQRGNTLEPKGLIVHFAGFDRRSVAPTCILWNPKTKKFLRRAFIDCRWIPVEITHKQDLELQENGKSTEEKFSEWQAMEEQQLDLYGNTIIDGQRRSKRLMVNAVLQPDEIHYGYDLTRTTPEIRQLFDEPINNEIQNLIKHNVLEEVNSIPRGAKIINSQFVFNIKKDGAIKARWVACGNQQRALENAVTYAPTVNRSLILILLKTALQQELAFTTIDISAAYLHGKLDPKDQVYIRAPYPLPQKTYKVIGNLYGLKQAGNIWNRLFTEKMEEFGLLSSKLDPCLFYRTNDSPIYLLLHVDDGLLLAKSEDIDRLLKYLQEHFDVKKNPSEEFLGIQILQSDEGMLVKQTNYINRILKKYGFMDCKSTDTPIAHNTELSLVNPDEILKDRTEFQSLLGSLNFCRLTRPDLLYAMHTLSTVASRPGDDALTTMKRSFRYLSGTKEAGVIIEKESAYEWKCYVDASYAAGTALRSTGGYVIFMGSTPVMARSYNIAHAVDSSAHAEAYALYEAVKDIQFVASTMKELKIQVDKITVFTDSKALKDFSFKNGSGRRSRHWDISLHYIKTFMGPGKLIQLEYVAGDENIADIFTKPLGKGLFMKHSSKLVHTGSKQDDTLGM